MYKIKIEKFQGPLDILLQLIENQQLAITEIAIGEVTDQYIEYIEKMVDLDPEELADFLVLAARLLILKSRALLPILEEDEAVDDIARQLKIYKEFLDASKKIEAMLKLENFSFSRLRPPFEMKVEFSPAENLTVANLKQTMLAVLKRLDPLVKIPRQAIEKTVSLQQKILHLKDLLAATKKFGFKKYLSEAKNKTEVIMGFLAILELVKQKFLKVKQNKVFDDITIERL
jgi:segregation and condensation protein A